MASKPGPVQRAIDAATCALVPGPCVVRAVQASRTVAQDTTATARARASAAATAAAAGVSSSTSSVITDAGDALSGVIREAAAPVESQASAARYVAVATAIVVVALVVGVIYVTRKVL